MKRIKQWLLALLVGAVVLTPVSVGAEELPADGEPTPPAATETEEAPASFETAEPETVGQMLLTLLETYAGELVAFVTLVVSLFNTYRYQKGLVPLVYGGIESVANAAGNATDEAKAIAEATDARLQEFIARTEPVLARLSEMCKGAESLEEEAKTLHTLIEEGEADRTVVKHLMAGVTDMLYRVFASANLPQYAKDAIGEQYTVLSQELKEAAHDTDPESQSS